MESEDIYVYLDLNGRLDHNFFQKDNIYFKMVNINTNSPLVQVGNYVFQGSYEDFLGTKVFFMENQDHEPNENVFIKESPIHLKYIAKTAKVMQLKWRKIPTNVVHVNKNECTDLCFTENYNTVLEKLEKGALNMQDIIYDSTKQQAIEPEKPAERKDLTSDVDNKVSDKQVVEQTEIADKDTDDILDIKKYNLLKNLAEMPTKQKEILKVYEINTENLTKVENADNFSVLRQLFLQNVIFKSDAIKNKDCEFNKYVDIQKSIEDGIITNVSNDGLSDEQRSLLLSEQNFDNFNLPMKLTYLTQQLEEYKKLLAMKSPEELKSIDEYGRTFMDKYRLLKKITKQVWYYVYLNYSDYM